MLIKRVVTGIILVVATLLSVLFLSPILFMTVVSFVLLWATWEWCQFIELNSVTSKIFYLIVVGVMVLVSMTIPINIILLITLFWWLLSFVFVISYSLNLSLTKWLLENSIWRAVMGVLTLIPSWLAINHMFQIENGRKMLLFLISIVSISDISAYFFGKFYGKNKLLPKISPKKTWQGVYAALISTFCLAVLVTYRFHMPIDSRFSIILLTLIVCGFSIIGDLFESMLKRLCGMKDSGHFLPGHGGILDRIDGLLAATPIFLLIISWLGFVHSIG